MWTIEAFIKNYTACKENYSKVLFTFTAFYFLISLTAITISIQYSGFQPSFFIPSSKCVTFYMSGGTYTFELKTTISAALHSLLIYYVFICKRLCHKTTDKCYTLFFFFLLKMAGR